MDAGLINIGLAFIEGIALIISPCILPILPIILSASLTGSRARPLGIITGFVLIFGIVTLFSRAIIQFSHISQDTIRNASLIILIILALIMMSDYLSNQFARLTGRMEGVGHSLKTVNSAESGFWGGFIFGGLVGIIWTPCAGPILAAIIVQVVLQHTGVMSIFTVLAFGIGVGLPMLLIALLGRRLIQRFQFLREKAVLMRKILGFIILLSVIYIFYITNAAFSYDAYSSSKQIKNNAVLINPVEYPYDAPAISGIDAWINSPPLTMDELKGKVVLIDFWTYSCINCIRSLPYVKAWYAKYRDQGLVVIGVHSPEFEFERDLQNVKNAVARFGILYPVALDNHFETWQNFHNEYWPAHYLINREGKVVYEHFGEGEYDTTENNIRFLLGMGQTQPPKFSEQHDTSMQTPETYLGYKRAERFSSPYDVVKNKIGNYHYPNDVMENNWALNGKWIIYPDKIVAAEKGAAIKLHYDAKNVYIVMGAPKKAIQVKLLNNGLALTEGAGKDVKNSQITVKNNQLYHVIEGKKQEEGTLEITTTTPGLEVYTFTFG